MASTVHISSSQASCGRTSKNTPRNLIGIISLSIDSLSLSLCSEKGFCWDAGQQGHRRDAAIKTCLNSVSFSSRVGLLSCKLILGHVLRNCRNSLLKRSRTSNPNTAGQKQHALFAMLSQPSGLMRRKTPEVGQEFVCKISTTLQQPSVSFCRGSQVYIVAKAAQVLHLKPLALSPTAIFGKASFE